MFLFEDCQDAGRKLAAELDEYAHDENIIVLGLPRGGIPVAYEVAQALHAPLDIFLVRKLGLPGHEELAMEKCTVMIYLARLRPLIPALETGI